MLSKRKKNIAAMWQRSKVTNDPVTMRPPTTGDNTYRIIWGVQRENVASVCIIRFRSVLVWVNNARRIKQASLNCATGREWGTLQSIMQVRFQRPLPLLPPLSVYYFDKQDKMKLLAKFKKILYMGFRAILNLRVKEVYYGICASREWWLSYWKLSNCIIQWSSF